MTSAPLICELDRLRNSHAALVTALEQASAYCETLAKYVRHHSTCESFSGRLLPIALACETNCTCGASDALKGAALLREREELRSAVTNAYRLIGEISSSQLRDDSAREKVSAAYSHLSVAIRASVPA